MIKSDYAANAVKMLAADMIDNAKSGFIADNLGSSSIIYALYANGINILNNNPTWINRDRFILANKNIDASLYAMLFYAGFNYSIDELKNYHHINFNQNNNHFLNADLAVEYPFCGSEGISTAVGISLGEKYLETICHSANNKSELINFSTIVLCSERDLQDGKAYEALSFASNQNLSRFIIIIDSSDYQDEDEVENISKIDLEDFFDALNFDVLYVNNGSNVNEITKAIESAKKSKIPCAIIIKTKRGKDSTLENDIDAHFKMLQKGEKEHLKEKYNLPIEEFAIDYDVQRYIIQNMQKRVNKIYEKWLIELEEVRKSGNEKLNNVINLLMQNEIDIDFDTTNYKLTDKYDEKLTISNHKTINLIASKTSFFIGGTLDNITNTLVNIESSGFMNDENPSGRNINFGNRTSAIGGILNGISLLNIKTFAGIFLSKVPMLYESINLSNLLSLPVTYIFTHDGVSTPDNGYSYNLISNIGMLRLIKNLKVFRPADISEVMGSWEYAINMKTSVSIIISNEKLNKLRHTNSKYVKYGAYIVRKEKKQLNAIIIASGSEVMTSIKISEILYTEGIDVRVVSMPSVELFLKQKKLYASKLLPESVKTIILEKGNDKSWYRFTKHKENIIAINSLNDLGYEEEILLQNGFDKESLYLKIKNLIIKE